MRQGDLGAAAHSRWNAFLRRHCYKLAMRSHSARIAVTLVAILSAACAADPAGAGSARGGADPATAVAMPEQWHAPATRGESRPDLAQWWQGFRDPLLSELVTRALAANPDLDAARARLRAARAALRGSRGAFLPSVGASAQASRRDTSGSSQPAVDSYQAGFDASWEIDVFGGLRSAARASRADLARAAANLDDVRRSLVAELALGYIDARSAQERLAVAQRNLGYQDESVQITGWRSQAGLVSTLDLEQAKLLRAQTAATIPQLQASFQGAANRIALLLGEPAGSVTARLEAGGAIPAAPVSIEAGIPADLLRRRPDVIAAERSLAAEVARIGVARADLFPALRLSGVLSSTAASVGDLGASADRSLVAGITAPLFQGGRLRARLAQQRASADAALAVYRGTVLGALEEAESALVTVDAARRREEQLALAEDAALAALQLADAQYRAGLIDFQSLLDAQRSLLGTQDGRVVARAARSTGAIQLYKALGGGWVPSAETEVTQ